MVVGRRLYYDKLTGEIIIDTGERKGNTRVLTIEEEIEIYEELSSVERDSFDFIQLKYGQYLEEFNNCSSYKINININTFKIDFDYTDLIKGVD